MPSRIFNFAALVWFPLLLLAPAKADELHHLPEPATHAIAFRREVLPILSQHCFRCHSKNESKGKLKVNGRAEMLGGGESGPAIVPGNSRESLLVRLVAGLDRDRIMPAEGARLSDEQISILRAWIDQGAAWDVPNEYRLPLLNVQLPEGEGHPVDRLLSSYLAKHAITSRDSIRDEQFARRAALDLVGIPPSPKQLAEFLEDCSSNKRARFVQRLLANHENYVAHWMTFWSDHLRIGSAVDAAIFDNDQTKAPQQWLKAQLDRDVPYDQFVREMISGEFFEQYARSIAPQGEVASPVDRPEMQLATTLSQVFLGIQLKCASCHDSFVDRWTLEDAWGLASALGKEQVEIHRCQVATGQKAQLRFPLPALGDIDQHADVQERRQKVAELMTDARNGLFARTIINRLWARLFGRGLVEPLDEMMDHEAWNAELLDWLATEFVRRNYDIKEILQLIVTSQAYQLPAVIRQQPLQGTQDKYVFQGPEVRWLTAEQFVDSLSALRHPTDDESQRSAARIPRAWQSQNDRLLTVLGRPGREVVVTSRVQEASPLVALELINGSSLERLVEQAAESQLKRSSIPDQLGAQIYRMLLTRDPTARERVVVLKVLGSQSSQKSVADLIWMVLMLPEFQLLP